MKGIMTDLDYALRRSDCAVLEQTARYTIVRQQAAPGEVGYLLFDGEEYCVTGRCDILQIRKIVNEKLL